VRGIEESAEKKRDGDRTSMMMHSIMTDRRML